MPFIRSKARRVVGRIPPDYGGRREVTWETSHLYIGQKKNNMEKTTSLANGYIHWVLIPLWWKITWGYQMVREQMEIQAADRQNTYIVYIISLAIIVSLLRIFNTPLEMFVHMLAISAETTPLWTGFTARKRTAAGKWNRCCANGQREMSNSLRFHISWYFNTPIEHVGHLWMI